MRELDKEESWNPSTLDDYVGQPDLIRLLNDEVDASRAGNHALPHMIFHGAPGLGKNTLVHLLAKARRVPIHWLMGPSVTISSLAETLARLGSDPDDPQEVPAGYNDQGYIVDQSLIVPPIVCIDEMEAMPRALFEVIHKVAEPEPDGRRLIEVTLPGRKQSQQAWVVECTIIGLTNYYGVLRKKSEAFLNRIDIKWQFQPYSLDELVEVIDGLAESADVEIEPIAATLIAERCHGIPRTAKLLFQRTMSRLRAMQYREEGAHQDVITAAIVGQTMQAVKVDDKGLGDMAKQYLHALGNSIDGKLSLPSIAAILTIDEKTITIDVEPALIKARFVQVISGGRMITSLGLEHLRL